ncbi:MotA/TolQ/ExbB proton channel family protein [Curvibacter sp. CHRR-16]|uniref:MotA/TolQ/ExbB proton channel family protein n=1 Tax=Curvibacter sp. CHRR-16 TaxID=2835872 RepID=UPI001BDAB9E0|nr:MotA/TolQ/ExbB proton channel family protein [Curvibacter sp. CHRR-16]MBT0571158.1 MotA/TolQ/ExbB proton channel family protein [Curvibacter sp. CHRR-16]
MNNTAGIMGFWLQSDWVGKSVALLLLAMSIASWAVIVIKALDAWRYKQQAKKTEAFWHSETLPQALQTLGEADNNLFTDLALAGQSATQHHRHTQEQLHDVLDLSDWVNRCLRNSIDDSAARMQTGLALLASVGSTAPFVGLFGTVWGIYHALMAMGQTGQANIGQVAGPIGEALIMTACGLAVAIPAVVGYNALTRSNKFVLSKLHRFAHDLHAFFVTGTRVTDGEKNSPALRLV